MQQSFANSLAGMAANYEGQLAMLKVQHKMEVDALNEQLGEHAHDEVPEDTLPGDVPAPKAKRK